jgi:hypothetical protein
MNQTRIAAEGHRNPLRYEGLVEKHEIQRRDKRLIYIEKESDTLLISLSTHNQGNRYQSLVTFSDLNYSLLFLTNPGNNYYLESDGGKSYYELVREFASLYATRRLVFTGSSMAGYSAIKMSFEFGGNAVVSNPQVDFYLTRMLCWEELRKNIEKIPETLDIVDIENIDKTSINFAYGRYPMDLANAAVMMNIAFKRKNLDINFIESRTKEHRYLFPTLTAFVNSVEDVLRRRTSCE